MFSALKAISESFLDSAFLELLEFTVLIKNISTTVAFIDISSSLSN